MDTTPQPEFTHQLPRELHYLAVHALSEALPPPITNSPEDHIRRDNAIIADVASLRPATTAEAILAAQCIAANAQALDCLRLARLTPVDAPLVLKCTAQSVSMMRQSRGALGHLLRLQAAREKRKPGSNASNAASTMEQATQRLLADAIAELPSASPDEPPPPQPASTDRSGALAKAEAYARANPSSAALIRSLGRLPKKFVDAAMTPDLLHAIVNGDSPILQALVKKPAHRLATAA